jgi:hypothetical protein
MSLLTPPVLQDLAALFLFGVDPASSLINRAPNAVADGTFVSGGSGEFADNWAKLNINYSLDSAISYNGFNKTIISVSEFAKDQHSSVVAPHVEMSLINNAFRVRVASAGYLFGAGSTIGRDIPQFQALSSGGSDGLDTAIVGRSGVLDTATASATSVTAGNIVFGPRGGRDSISDTTGHKHYLGLIYNRELSVAEVAEVYAWAATEFAKKYILVA